MSKKTILKISKEHYKFIQENILGSKDKKKLIIKESQYNFLKNVIVENNNYDRILKSIAEDLDLNYEPSVGTKEIGNEFFNEPLINKKVNGETITPALLFDYLKQKYSVSEDFVKQVIDDWYKGTLKETGRLSKNVSP